MTAALNIRGLPGHKGAIAMTTTLTTTQAARCEPMLIAPIPVNAAQVTRALQEVPGVRCRLDVRLTPADADRRGRDPHARHGGAGART